MEVKMLEVRDVGTFIPVLCVKPVPTNPAQEYLLRRDGYSCETDDRLVIVVKAQCAGCAYDPYEWGNRTMKTAHHYIEERWGDLVDGDVIDVQFILGETAIKKLSEKETVFA